MNRQAEIPGHPKYVVTASGGVINTSTGKVLRPWRDGQGYRKVTLRKHHFFVHRLVALAFIPNKKNKEEVNHKDGTKDNNAVDNLEWCTPVENIAHAAKAGLRENTFNYFKRLRKLKPQEILTIRNSTEKITTLASEYRVAWKTIRKIKDRSTYKEVM